LVPSKQTPHGVFPIGFPGTSPEAFQELSQGVEISKVFTFAEVGGSWQDDWPCVESMGFVVFYHIRTPFLMVSPKHVEGPKHLEIPK